MPAVRLRVRPVPPRRGAIVTLRPWGDVAKEFRRRTGLRMTEHEARSVAYKAHRKLRRLMAAGKD